MAGWATPDVFEAPDGARLSIRREPARGASRGSIVFVHGWGDYTGRWVEQAAWFAEHGLNVIGIDQRGHGKTPGTRGHVDRFAQYLSDLGAVRKLAAAEVPGPQLLMGHSFGGFIVLRYLETAPQRVAGAIALTPYVDLYGASRVEGEDGADDRGPPAAAADPDRPRVPGDLEGSRDRRTLPSRPALPPEDDPARVHRAMHNLEVLQAERERIHAPLFIALAGEDHIVSTPAAEQFAHGIAGDVKVRTYDGMYHNILHEPDRDRVYADLAPWLDETLHRQAAA